MESLQLLESELAKTSKEDATKSLDFLFALFNNLTLKGHNALPIAIAGLMAEITYRKTFCQGDESE